MKQYRPQDLEGKYNGPLLITGSGRCIYDDLLRVRPWKHDWMAVNDTSCFLQMRGGHLKHHFTYHPSKIQHWKGLAPPGEKFISHSHKDTAECVWQEMGKDPVHEAMGTSVMGAVWVACRLGYDPIVLAGAPMDGTGRWYDAPDFLQADYSKNLEWWERYAPRIKGRVFPLSGNLVKFLGCAPNRLGV